MGLSTSVGTEREVLEEKEETENKSWERRKGGGRRIEVRRDRKKKDPSSMEYYKECGLR